MWISSWLSERSQKVVLDGQASDPVPVLFVVLKDRSWDRSYFSFFINDLPENIRSSVRLFADDCVLYRNIKSHIDCQILQDDLNSLPQWETDWQMKFNFAKCHSMRVTRHLPENQIKFEYSLHQQRWERVQPASVNIYLRPKVTLHCLFIYLFRIFVSDIYKVFNSC